MRARDLFLRSLLAATSCVAVAGCSIDEGSNPTPRCVTTTDCASGYFCYSGYCIPGSVDGGMDGAMPDAGDAPGPDLGRDTPGCVFAGPEECNGVDDDCDGETDNLPRNDDTTCSNGEFGVCATAHQVCPDDGGATPVCRRDVEPRAETCNDLDDDCDDKTDENSDRRCYPDGADGCSLVAGRYVCRGGCGAGIQLCEDGEYGECLQPSVPVDEACTEAGETAGDEDCDTRIDEGCADCVEDSDCYPGDVRFAGNGECRIGNLDCDSHMCFGFGMPSDETCANAGQDNDCDDVVDNVPGTGLTCFDDDMQGICRTGITACDDADDVVCVTPEMSAMELCDGLDDDCDGSIDNGYDFATREDHCGACDAACPAGLWCWMSECRNGATDDDYCGATDDDDGTACADGVECCNGGCNDYQTDPNNCGSCGHACDAGDACCGGECVDDDYDENHCGDCGTVCEGTTPQCCTGTCSAAGACDVTPEICTAMGMTLCGGACVDPQTDEAYCGAAGTCGAACAPGSLCCGGTCVPNDEDHCGSCDTECDGGDLCCSGACVDSNNAHCGSCTTTCGAGLECCGTVCSTRNTDAHCGTCGNACADGQSCSNGHCCPDGWGWCGGACVNLATNFNNCGSCGNMCDDCVGLLCLGGSETCVGGRCEL